MESQVKQAGPDKPLHLKLTEARPLKQVPITNGYEVMGI